MIKQVVFHTNQQLTNEQKQMLINASLKPIEYDEDSPEVTDEQLKQFTRVRK